jgi:hypothetical protein
MSLQQLVDLSLVSIHHISFSTKFQIGLHSIHVQPSIVKTHAYVPCSFRHFVDIHILPLQRALYVDYAREDLGAVGRFDLYLTVDVFFLIVASDHHLFIVMVAHNKDFFFKSNIKTLFLQGFELLLTREIIRIDDSINF